MRTDDFADLRFEDFFATVEADLRMRQVPFERRELQEFMDAMRPAVLDGDSVEWWADTFLEAMAAERVE
jgi:hypothetical protein